MRPSNPKPAAGYGVFQISAPFEMPISSSKDDECLLLKRSEERKNIAKRKADDIDTEQWAMGS
jgi:hypothetical protein